MSLHHFAAIVTLVSATAGCTSSSPLPTTTQAPPPATLTPSRTPSSSMATLQARWAIEELSGTYTPSPQPTPHVSSLPSGEYIVFSAEQPTGARTRTLYALPLDQGQAIKWLSDTICEVAISPDGNSLAYFTSDERANWASLTASPSYLGVIDLATGQVRQSPPGHWTADFDWSPDGSKIIMAQAAATSTPPAEIVALDPAAELVAIDPEDWRVTLLIDCAGLTSPISHSSCFDVASSPQGAWIGYFLSLEDSTDPRQGGYLMPADCLAAPETCLTSSRGPFPIEWPKAWSPDGRYIATTCRSAGPGICIYDSANMEQVRTVPHTDELESIQHLAWSRDGTKLVYTASNYMEVIDATSGRSIREIWHDGHVQVKFWLRIQ